MKKLPLILIILISVLTPLLSTLLFFVWRPAEQVNHGEMLPPQPPAAVVWEKADGGDFSLRDWRGKWVLLTTGAGDCDENCQQRLCRLRLLRLLLPGNYFRLQRAWLITDSTSPPPSVPQRSDCGEVSSEQLLAHTRTVDTLDGVDLLYGKTSDLPPAAANNSDEYLYLLDPAGVWVMRFAADLSPQQIRQDLARLLKLSKGRRLIEVKPSSAK